MEKFHAIVLKSFDFQEREKILTLFTEERGILSMIVKRISPKNPYMANLCSPLALCEFHALKGKSDLWKYRDGSLLDLHLTLRSDHEFMQSGFLFLNAIAKTQMPEKPSPALFALLQAYLRQIPSFESQNALRSSFFLNLLFHEGPMGPNHEDFTHEENNLIKAILLERSFTSLKSIDVSKTFSEKLQRGFDQIL